MLLVGVVAIILGFVVNVILDATARHLVTKSEDPLATALLRMRSQRPFGDVLAREALHRAEPPWISGLKRILGFVAMGGLVLLVLGILADRQFSSLQSSFMTMFATGAMLMTYGSIAREQGWQAGSLFLQSRAPLMLVALACLIGSIVLSLVAGPWWRAIVTLVGGFTISSGVIPLLRQWVQPIALLGVVISWIWALTALSPARSEQARRPVEAWPYQEKAAYVNRCTGEITPQLQPPASPREVCQCLADSLEAEFGLSDYAAMMAAQPDPKGNSVERRLYRVVTACLR